MKKDDVVGGVLLLVALLAIGSFFLFAQQAPELAYGPVEIPGSTLDVLSGTTLTRVDVQVTAVQSSFVTIHESIGGAPGPIVGVSSFIAEHHEGFVSVDIPGGLTQDSLYVALLHVDNGDGVFVVADDMPVTSDGASVRADFTSPASSAE